MEMVLAAYTLQVPLCYLDPRKPFAITVLGHKLVVWYDRSAGKWRCFEDRCPHRLAPLSGRSNLAHLEQLQTRAQPHNACLLLACLSNLLCCSCCCCCCRHLLSTICCCHPPVRCCRAEGRIDPATGQLSCSYHGWRFNGLGRCSVVPQADSARQEEVVQSSSRACVASYPVRLQQKLLWVWMDPSPGAAHESAARPVALSTELLDGSGTLLGDW